MNIRILIPLLLLLLVGAGIIILPRTKSSLTSLSSKKAAQQSLAHLDQILAFGPRPPGSEGLEKTRQYIQETLEQSDWQVIRQEFTYHTPAGPLSFVNLRARFSLEKSSGAPPHSSSEAQKASLWNSTPKGLLCAHIDSKKIDDFIFLGADDAGSAVSLLLTFAQDLAQTDPKRAAQIELVFFDGEEALGPDITPQDGIYGSRYYASSQWLTAPSKPSFGIVLDMIGHKNLQIAYPADSPQELVTVLNQSAKKMGYEHHFYRARGPIIDDHFPLNRAGIPTIDLIGDFTRFPWWHQANDDRSNISAISLKITYEVLSQMLQTLLPSSE